MKKTFLFIILIRAIAAILITNAHYVGVYPTNLIANGGLLGDVLFFSVSGFCLANTNEIFGKWYLRRFIRVYTPAIIMTAIWVLLGIYSADSAFGWFKLFLWPTKWHFVASIILLYIPLFFISKYITMNGRNYLILAASLLLVQLILYYTVYDRSVYHIDNVHQPMIEFIFFQSMLLGLYYRNRCNLSNTNLKLSYTEIILLIVLFPLYFVSKMMFVKIDNIAEFQILNQIVLWLFLVVLFDVFMKLEDKLVKYKDGKKWKVVTFIADHTLEIYLVQYVLIRNLKIGQIGKYAPFPLNWFLLTACIVVCAVILRYISQFVIKKIKI